MHHSHPFLNFERTGWDIWLQDDVLSCSRQAASALQANDVRSDPAAASTLFNSGSMMLRALLLLVSFRRPIRKALFYPPNHTPEF